MHGSDRRNDMSQDTASILKGSPLFSSLDDDDLTKIANISRERQFAAGERLISKGDSSALGMWIVLDGEVVVSSDGNTLATFGTGEHVGETALVSNEPRSADVDASVTTTTLQITRWELRGLMKEHPSLAVGILDAMASRLAKSNQALNE